MSRSSSKLRRKELSSSTASLSRLNSGQGELHEFTEREREKEQQKKMAKKLIPYGPKAQHVFESFENSSISSSEWEDIAGVIEEKTTGRKQNSKDTEKEFSHVQQIKHLIGAFFSDFEGSTIDLLSGMLLVMTFHDFREDLTGNKLALEDPAWTTGRYFMKFAAAAYGNMLACLKMKKKFFQYWWGDMDRGSAPTAPKDKGKKYGFGAIPPKGDKRVVFEHTGIAEEDFICGRWGAGVARGGSEFLPGYYLCVDHNSDSVILALRGSSNLNDALTDLVGQYEPYRDGAVHRGIFHMTKILLEKLKEPIFDTLGKFPAYSFIVCGHSLGAGVTSLFTLLFHDLYPNISIHGHAYACPCTMDSVLAQYCEPFLSTYVHGDDCVSRISLGSLDELKITMHHFLENSGKSLGTRLFHVTKHLTGIQSDRLAHLFLVSRAHGKKSVEDYKGHVRMQHLYPPGKIYHFYKDEEGIMQGELSHFSKFGHVVISSTMFTDHMPHIYEKALKKLADPYREVAKGYYRRFLRHSPKSMDSQGTMMVSINPLAQSKKSTDDIWDEAQFQNQNIPSMIRHVNPFLYDHPLVRKYNISEINVSFAQELSAPLLACDKFEGFCDIDSDDIFFDSIESSMVDVNEDDFFECANTENSTETWDEISTFSDRGQDSEKDLLLIQSTLANPMVEYKDVDFAACEGNGIPQLEALSVDSLSMLQSKLWQWEQDLKTRERRMEEREEALSELEVTKKPKKKKGHRRVSSLFHK